MFSWSWKKKSDMILFLKCEQIVSDKKTVIPTKFSQKFIHDTQNIQQNIHSFKTASSGLKQTNLCCSFPAPPLNSSVATSHVSTKAECYFSVCVCLCCLHHIAGCPHSNMKTSLQVCSGMIISPAVTFKPGTHLKAADVSAQVRLQVISLSPAAADA